VPPYYGVRRRRLILFLLLSVLALGVLTQQLRTADRRGIGWIGTAAEAGLAPLVAGLSRVSDAVAQQGGSGLPASSLARHRGRAITGAP